MKSTIVAIPPKECAKIANHKISAFLQDYITANNTPLKCFIYCKEGNEALVFSKDSEDVAWSKPFVDGDRVWTTIDGPLRETCAYRAWNERVIGELTCNNIAKYRAEFYNDKDVYQDICKVLVDDNGEEYTETVITNESSKCNDCELLKALGMSFDDIRERFNYDDAEFYVLDISDLKIYNEPKVIEDVMYDTMGISYGKLGKQRKDGEHNVK